MLIGPATTPEEVAAAAAVVQAAYAELAGSEHWGDDRDAMLRFLAVLPAARGLGVGRALLDDCLARARAAGRARVALHSAAPMTTAIGLYRRAGFERDPVGDWRDGALSVDGYALRLGAAHGSPDVV